MLISSAQVANLPYLFSNSLYNKGGWFCVGAYFFLLGIYILRSYSIGRFFYIDISFLVFFICLIFLSLVSLLFYNINHQLIKDLYHNKYNTHALLELITKPLLFITAYSIVSKFTKSDIDSLFRHYSYLFFILCVIALFIYFALEIDKEKLVFYQGERFAAFHFELVYFSFSALIVVLTQFRLNRISSVTTFIVVAAMLVNISKSNMLPIYLLVVLGSAIILYTKWLKYLYHWLVLAGVIAFLFLAYFLVTHTHYLEAISFLFPRADFSYKPGEYSSNSILSRIAIHYSGLKYFLDNIANMPPGISGSVYMVNFANEFIHDKQVDASGLTKFLADFSLFSLPFLVIFCLKLRKVGRFVNRNNFSYFAILNLAIFTIVFHAGYLNSTVWIIIFLAYRYMKLTDCRSILVGNR